MGTLSGWLFFSAVLGLFGWGFWMSLMGMLSSHGDEIETIPNGSDAMVYYNPDAIGRPYGQAA